VEATKESLRYLLEIGEGLEKVIKLVRESDPSAWDGATWRMIESLSHLRDTTYERYVEARDAMVDLGLLRFDERGFTEIGGSNVN